MRKFDIFHDETYPPRTAQFFEFDLYFSVRNEQVDLVEKWLEKYKLKLFSSKSIVCSSVHYALQGGCRYEDSDAFHKMVFELYCNFQKKLQIGYTLKDTLIPTHNSDGCIPPNCVDFNLFISR